MKWWAYLHVNGTVQLKRYFDQRDIDEAKCSSFVVRYIGPFEATSRDEAMQKALLGVWL